MHDEADALGDEGSNGGIGHPTSACRTRFVKRGRACADEFAWIVESERARVPGVEHLQ
jgi:hypothetical protein